MKRRLVGAIVTLVLVVATSPVVAQIKGERFLRVPDSSAVQVVRLADGSSLVGRFVDVSGDPVRFETGGGIITIRRADLRDIKEMARGAVKRGQVWFDDPNPTRLFVGPTARSLPKGEGDFSSTYLFFVSGGYGVGGNAQIGGGFSIFPLDDFKDNIFFLTAKVGVKAGKNAQLAVGGLLGWAGGFGDELGGNDGVGLGALYGVGTFGSQDHALTVGVIMPFAEGDFANHLLLMFGGETRVARRLKLITENYVSTEGGDALLGYGLRIFGEKMSVSLGLFNSTDEGVFPGVPYVDFVIRF